MLRSLNCESDELSIVLTNDSQIKKLNQIYRHKDKPTDVLAFAQNEGEYGDVAGNVLGDVIVSVPTAARQAREKGHALLFEVTYLLAHGLLHLLGWDHETAAKDRKMRAKTDVLMKDALARPPSHSTASVRKRIVHRPKK